MKAELKTKWIEALRSGKYNQGRRALVTNQGSYCCLGVLCDVMGKEKETLSGFHTNTNICKKFST